MKNWFRVYFSSDYLWTPASGAKFEKYYLAVSLAILALAIFYRIYIFVRGNRPEVLKSFDRYFFWGYLTFGLLGLFVYFSRTQSLPIFSTRAISWFWILCVITHTIFLAFYWRKQVPQKLAKFYENKRKSKYLVK